MPRDSVAAEPQGAKEGAEQPGTSSAAETSSSIPITSASDILRHAGVPEEVVTAFTETKGEEKTAAPPKSGAQPDEDEPSTEDAPTEGDEAEEGESAEESEPSTEGDEEAEAEGESTDETEPAHAEAEADAADEPEEGQKPNWYQKRLAKWSRQKDRLQDEIDELKEQLARKQETPEAQPQPAQPGRDVFGNIEDVGELQRIVELQRQVRDWCMENPEGMVVNEGKEDEKTVTPEEVRKTLIGATRIIEDAPRKAAEIQARQQWRAFAQDEWPELFDKKSEIYQTSQQFLEKYPAVAQNPNRDFILGLMVEGWRTFKPRMEAKLKGQAQPAANGTNNGKLPEALKRKIPPIPKTQAPNPPRGSRVPSPIKNAAAAVDRVATEGASPESVYAAIEAIERQNAASGGAKRTPAPV